MIAAELRGGNKPSLEEALGWIGSRVDDIYGANVGRLEDVWIDPASGLPRWLLVKGRFGGRTTLIPFDHATAGAGHVWVPYEREVVRDAPELPTGARPTPAVEAALLAHYAGRAPGESIGSASPEPRMPALQSRPVARTRGQFPPEGPRPQPPISGFPPYRPMPRPQPREPQAPYTAQRAYPEPPLPPVPAPPQGEWPARPPAPPERPPWPAPAPPAPAPPAPTQRVAPAEEGGWAVGSVPLRAAEPPPPAPAPEPSPADALKILTSSSEASEIEIELSGEISIRGEIVRIRITPKS